MIADSLQPEVAYTDPSGKIANARTYTGDGIPVGGFFDRLAFAVHLHDFNLLVSSLVGSNSKLIYIPDVRSEVQKALPFLSVDSNPYAVIVNGQLDWVVDAYVTSNYYPCSSLRPPLTDALSAPGSGDSPGPTTTCRDSLKVVVDAYSGKIELLLDRHAGSDPHGRDEEIFPLRLIKPLDVLGQDRPAGLSPAPAVPAGSPHGPGRGVRPLPREGCRRFLRPLRRVEPRPDLRRRRWLAVERASRPPRRAARRASPRSTSSSSSRRGNR